MGLDLAFDDLTSSLAFNLSPPTSQDLDVDVVVNNLGTNPTGVENLLLAVLPLVFPDLVTGLGEFPLPQFLGLNLQGVDVDRQGAFMSLFADLVPAP